MRLQRIINFFHTAQDEDRFIWITGIATPFFMLLHTILAGVGFTGNIFIIHLAVLFFTILSSYLILSKHAKNKRFKRAENDFISIAAHQLRTPLSAIKWIIEIMSEADSLTAKQQGRLKQLYGSNERMIQLVNDLLNVSRIESGKVAAKKELVAIPELIKAAIKSLKPEADKKQQKISVTINDTVNRTLLDAMLLDEAFKNILSNAIAYGLPESEIIVTLSVRGPDCLITINNQGPTIPATESDKIFTKFYRGLEARKIKPSGTGLGLFIAKSAIEANGGKIWYESSSHQGTTFYFTISHK